MNKINIGIVGCGIIGEALKTWVENHNKNCSLFISDPPKGLNDDLSTCDVIFVSLHIKTEENNLQDLTSLKQVIKTLPNVPVFIRTTLIPGTSDELSRELDRKIYFMPEFLTERTAYQDFCNQPMIFTGEVELLKQIFIGKKFIEMTSKEAEIAKYAHNVFAALKVTYFNGIYELAQKENCNYNKIQEGVLLSGYINKMHTNVPGPDGSLGYGGKCLPKDLDAFLGVMSKTNIHNIIFETKNANKVYRG